METKPFPELSEGLTADIVNYIENNQPSIYWDRGDELSKEQICKIFESEDGLNEIENEIYDNNVDYIWNLTLELKNEVLYHFKTRIISELGLNEAENEDEEMEWEEKFKDFCNEYISVDIDVRELARMTNDQTFFYDTCQELSDPYPYNAKDRLGDLKRVKKTLGIKTGEFNDTILEMIENASYGGRLVVYFQAGILDLCDWPKSTPPNNFIKFSGDVHIAIIDTAGGSGYDKVITHEFELPFDRDNLFYEDSIKYNYSWAVCGMCHDWCDSTKFSFHDKKSKKSINKSSLTLARAIDRTCTETYRKGGCTAGDMDFSRHRNMEYVNHYPCGSRCKDCGTFWVD